MASAIEGRLVALCLCLLSFAVLGFSWTLVFATVRLVVREVIERIYWRNMQVCDSSLGYVVTWVLRAVIDCRLQVNGNSVSWDHFSIKFARMSDLTGDGDCYADLDQGFWSTSPRLIPQQPFWGIRSPCRSCWLPQLCRGWLTPRVSRRRPDSHFTISTF
jgi:hypothetical protein